MRVFMYVCLFVGLSVCMYVCRSVGLCVCVSVCPSVCMYVCIYVCMCEIARLLSLHLSAAESRTRWELLWILGFGVPYFKYFFLKGTIMNCFYKNNTFFLKEPL